MTPENFCYWLQGLFEVGGAESLSSAQTQIVKDHLALVFNKVTPKYSLGPLNTICPKSRFVFWEKDNWSYKDSSFSYFTGIPIDFSTALEDYKKDGNVSKHGTVGFIVGPNGGYIPTNEFSSFLGKTNSGQNVPPIKTNLYFGGESTLPSVDLNKILVSC